MTTQYLCDFPFLDLLLVALIYFMAHCGSIYHTCLMCFGHERHMYIDRKLWPQAKSWMPMYTVSLLFSPFVQQQPRPNKRPLEVVWTSGLITVIIVTNRRKYFIGLIWTFTHCIIALTPDSFIKWWLLPLVWLLIVFIRSRPWYETRELFLAGQQYREPQLPIVPG